MRPSRTSIAIANGKSKRAPPSASAERNMPSDNPRSPRSTTVLSVTSHSDSCGHPVGGVRAHVLAAAHRALVQRILEEAVVGEQIGEGVVVEAIPRLADGLQCFGGCHGCLPALADVGNLAGTVASAAPITPASVPSWAGTTGTSRELSAKIIGRIAATARSR